MEPAILTIILFYILSAVVYVMYLFFQKEKLQRAGYVLMLAGFLVHTFAIGYEFVPSGRIPARNLYETLLLAGWAVAGFYLVLQYKYNLKILGVYAAPLTSLVMIIASVVPRVPVQSNDLFKSFWLISHVFSIFIGNAAFTLACGLGILYLVQENAIKSKRHGFFFRRLPSLEMIDATAYTCIVIGFTMLTFGLITGFVYAKSVWGRFWGWDPKEVWSGITWLVYAALLHERLVVGWRGRRAAILTIVGFIVLLFTFLGVNFFLQGHHGEFTRF
jgi:cytochrome c-type biogenesis protein CcsB